MGHGLKDCSRCGAFLAEDEGICPTCGTVFGNRTEFQMPQLTPDMLSGGDDEAATISMSIMPEDDGSEAATIAMSAIPMMDDGEAATIAMAAIPGPPEDDSEAATVMISTIPEDFPDAGMRSAPAAQLVAGPPGAQGGWQAGQVAGEQSFVSADDDERNIPGMIIGIVVLLALVGLVGWLLWG